MSETIEHWDHGKGLDESTSSGNGLTLLGKWRWGLCRGPAMIDPDHVAIGNGELFQVLDVSDATNPQIVGEVITTAPVNDIAINGTYAFVTTWRGLDIIDIADITNPQTVVEGWRDSPPVWYVAVDPRGLPYVYLAGDDFAVVDVSNISEPQLVATLNVSEVIWPDMAIYMAPHEKVYVYGTNSQGMWIDAFDVTNPANPVHHNVSMTGSLGLAVADDHLFVGSSWDVQIYSLSEDPISPKIISKLEIPADLRDMVVAGEWLYLILSRSDTLTGVMTVDISNIENPEIVGTISWPGPPVALRRIIYSEGEVYVVSRVSLWGVDVSDPSDPVELFYFLTGDVDPRRIVCRDQYAYVAYAFAGMWILDLSDLFNPVHIGNFTETTFAFDITLNDTVAYLAASAASYPFTNYIYLLDISNQEYPTLISTIGDLDRLDPKGRMDISGGYLYFPGDSGIYVIDVDPPQDPHIVSILPIDRVDEISIKDSLAFVVRSYFPDTVGNGLHILDISNPIEPEKVSSYELWGAQQVEIVGSLAYFVTMNNRNSPGNNGFAIMDISNPQEPIQLSLLEGLPYFDGEGFQNGLAVSSSWAYRTFAETKIIYIENPEAPELYDIIDEGYHDVAIYKTEGGKDIILLDGYPGVGVYMNDVLSIDDEDNFPVPVDFVLYQNFPNPFNSKTAIRFQISTMSDVTLTVYNTLGQKIRTLVNNTLHPGDHTVMWDGKDDGGNKVSSGVYLYQLNIGEIAKIRKMILIK